MTRFLLPFALLLSCLAPWAPARAAACTEIGSVPTIITAPGSYCLAASVSVAMTSSAFVTINANDVLLDCRGMAIHNTQASPTGNAYAVLLQNRRGVRVRNCNLTGGWAAGIYAYQDNGLANANQDLAFTDNRIRGAFWYGILAYGTDIEIARNRITGIGGRASFAMGVRVGGSTLQGEPRLHVVRDNTIADVVSPASNAYGIYSNASDNGAFSGNTVAGTRSPGLPYNENGIRLAAGGHNRLTGNQVTGATADTYGIHAAATDNCYHNHLRNLYVATSGCDAGLGNY